MSKIRLTIAVLALSLVIALTAAYPNGAPDDSKNLFTALCEKDFRPGHGIEPQQTDAPYKITVSEELYKPGKPVYVILEPSGSEGFKGFFLYGKAKDGSGLLNDFQCDSTFSKNVTYCGQVGVTHLNSDPKRRIMCKWTPPTSEDEAGGVTISATVLKDFSTFWVNVDEYLLPGPDYLNK